MLVQAFEHEGELRADLQRHYGIDLDHAMAGEHSAGHVAALIAHMPHGQSVLYGAIDPDFGWTRQEILAAMLFNEFRGFEWSMADPRKRGPEPERFGPTWMCKHQRKLEARSMSVDELLAELSKPRR